MNKKVSILFIALVFFLFGSLFVKAEISYYKLEDLMAVLEQAKVIQKKIIEDEKIAANNPYKIEVLSPNGGDELIASESVYIRWDGINSGLSRIDIYLATSTEAHKSKEPGLIIAKNVPADSFFYSWIVPRNLFGDDFRILIKNTGKYRLHDYSDEVFSIKNKEEIDSLVKITSIEGGEIFYAGRTKRVSWNMEYGGERFVNLRLVKADSSATSTYYIPTGFQELLNSKDGVVDWMIPDIETGDYRMKIFGVSSECPYCLEPQAKNLHMTEPFKIVSKHETPNSISLIYPKGESDIEVDFSGSSTSTVNIKWFTPLDIDYVDIFLKSVPSGRIHWIGNNIQSFFDTGTSTNMYEWQPNIFSKEGEKFYLNICRVNTNYCDVSNRPFSIVSVNQEEASDLSVNEPDTLEYRKLEEIIDEVESILATIISNEAKKEENEENKDSNILDNQEKTYLPYTFDRRLSYGMIDDDGVRALQEALKKEGFFDHEVTGRFFEVTQKAVQDFQEKYGFDTSGSVGPGTQAKLNELYGNKEDVLKVVEVQEEIERKQLLEDVMR